jgi:D-beta-D-heptose 7-phosphate kinase/D-beta-D-heptose 1-phosphate adenosyltransferase
MRTRRGSPFLKGKIKNTVQLKRIVLKLKSQGKKIVFTNGCFDLLHYGHVKYLQEAKKKGDILVVAVNSDASVKRIKGDNRPIVNQQNRAKVLAGLESVDYVVIFKEDTPFKIIKILKPNILVKGSDWHKDNIVGRGIVSSYGGNVSTVKLVKGSSTTALIKKIAQKSRYKKY